jgi:hypothetical protein
VCSPERPGLHPITWRSRAPIAPRRSAHNCGTRSHSDPLRYGTSDRSISRWIPSDNPGPDRSAPRCIAGEVWRVKGGVALTHNHGPRAPFHCSSLPVRSGRRRQIWPLNRVSERVQHLWCICVGKAEEGGCSETVPATMTCARARVGTARHVGKLGRQCRPFAAASRRCRTLLKEPNIAVAR